MGRKVRICSPTFLSKQNDYKCSLRRRGVSVFRRPFIRLLLSSITCSAVVLIVCSADVFNLFQSFFDHLFCCLCNVNNINNLVINLIPLQLWCEVWSLLIQHFWSLVLFQGMIALRREATEVIHEDYMDGIMEVNAKKKANLMYYAWRKISLVNKQKKKL